MHTELSLRLVRYQYPATSDRHVQRFEYAEFGSAYGLLLQVATGDSWLVKNGRILGVVNMHSQQYKICLLLLICLNAAILLHASLMDSS